jgi:hypothetical protein
MAAQSELTAQQLALIDVRDRFERGEIDYDLFRITFDILMLTTDPVECRRILAELPPPPQRAVLDALDRTPAIAAAPAAPPTRLPRRRTFFTLVGELRRTKRPWKAGVETRAVALIGEIVLDLTLAALPPESHFAVTALIGEIEIIVPADADVTVRAFTFLGSSHALEEDSEGIFAYAHDSTADLVTAPRHHIEITVFALIGEVRVTRSAIPAQSATALVKRRNDRGHS